MAYQKIIRTPIIFPLLSFFVAVVVLNAQSADYPQWRGINRNGISEEKGLLKSWLEGGPRLLWSVSGIGIGYSSPSIANGFIYITGRKDNKEFLSALDLKGNIKWSTEYGNAFTESYPDARSTPTINGDSIYVISGRGEIVCFDLSGKIVWSVDGLKKFEGKYGSWGVAESPLIVDDKVIYTPCGSKTTMVALNKKTGETVWMTESLDDQSGYVGPILAKIGKKKQIITVTGKYVIGVDAENGHIDWKVSNKDISSPTDINCVSPVFYNGSVFVTSGYNDAGALIRISDDGMQATVSWVNPDLDVHHGGVVLVDGYIYGANWINNGKGNWVCLDWNTGKTMYESKWRNKGSIISADGMLYCYEEEGGNLALVKATPEGFNVISSFKITQGSGPHWAHPVISDGVLYMRHGDVLMAYDIKEK
ncbi:MAG: PQQ-binding-like beta-propeller repeat protein [Candidatus Poribacteria bacterium]